MSRPSFSGAGRRRHSHVRSYTVRPSGVRKTQEWKREPSTFRSVYSTVHSGSCSSEDSDLEEGEVPSRDFPSYEPYEAFSQDDSASSPESECSSYLEDLYEGRSNRDCRRRLSHRMDRPEVLVDEHKRDAYSGDNCAYQFNFRLKWVRQMLLYMWKGYRTVCVYSMGILEVGDIIYYLDPFVLGLHQNDQGANVSEIGRPSSTARVKLKGRFGIVVSKHAQHLKVVQMFTFNGKGLARARPQQEWYEWVGLRETGARGYMNPSPHKELEAGWSTVDIDPETSVHLIPDKISLGNQIMISGRVTDESTARLKKLIAKVDG